MSELPEGWAETSFMDVFDIQGGTQPPKSVFKYEPTEGYIRLLQIRDFGDKPLPTYIPNKDSLKRCVEDDVLIGRYGASVGRICTGMNGAYNVALAKVIVPQIVDKRFVFHFLKSELFQRPILDIERSAQDGFNKEDLSEISLPLPPLDEQRRIVAKLEKLLSRVDAAQARLANIPRILKRFRQSVLAAACSRKLTADWRKRSPNVEPASRRWDLTFPTIHNEDYPELPDTWVYRTLDNISVRVSVGHVGPTSQFYCAPSEGIAFLRSQNVRPMRLDLDGVACITKEFHGSLKKSQLKEGDLLVVRVGANRGDTCVVPSGVGEMNCANIILARPLNSISDYLNIYFQTPFCQKTLEDLTTGSAQGVINTKAVAEVPVPVPPLEEQQEIVRRVEALFKTADALEARYRTAKAHVDKLAQSILARAFRGELVTTEAELARLEGRDYEPASVLLERIRQEGAGREAPRRKSPAKSNTTKQTHAPKLF
ncbi:MAG: restriction endonuclease subunit S [Pyrinomonadaceae bacterium]|nr:restriction endonuclease subunit S [Pyrinomonadaceae bacterium]